MEANRWDQSRVSMTSRGGLKFAFIAMQLGITSHLRAFDWYAVDSTRADPPLDPIAEDVADVPAPKIEPLSCCSVEWMLLRRRILHVSTGDNPNLSASDRIPFLAVAKGGHIWPAGSWQETNISFTLILLALGFCWRVTCITLGIGLQPAFYSCLAHVRTPHVPTTQQSTHMWPISKWLARAKDLVPL